MSKEPPYERMTIAGIEMDVKKVETLYWAKSPRWGGFMVTGRTMKDLEEKLPDAMREYEQLIAEGDRNQEVLRAFAILRAEQEEVATKYMADNLDPERVLTLQAIRSLCATLWPQNFATPEEMALFKAKWDRETEDLVRELGEDDV